MPMELNADRSGVQHFSVSHQILAACMTHSAHAHVDNLLMIALLLLSVTV